MTVIGRLTNVISWLETHSRWNRLRALGESSLVRASILMPAFGYILLLNDNVQQYLILKFDGRLFNYLPSLWRVWLLFYGSFLLAIASLLYSALCPTDVKTYRSGYQMADAESEHIARLQEHAAIGMTLKLAYARMTPWEVSLFPLRMLQIKEGWSVEGFHDRNSAIAGMLIHIWTVENIRRPYFRISVFFLFWSGLVLVGFPAIVTFLQVTALLATRAL